MPSSAGYLPRCPTPTVIHADARGRMVGGRVYCHWWHYPSQRAFRESRLRFVDRTCSQHRRGVYLTSRRKLVIYFCTSTNEQEYIITGNDIATAPRKSEGHLPTDWSRVEGSNLSLHIFFSQACMIFLVEDVRRRVAKKLAKADAAQKR